MKNINLDDYPRDKHVYGTFYVNGGDDVFPEETKKLRPLFLLKCYVEYQFLTKGFRSMIFRTSNNKTRTIFCNLGAKVIDETKI
jgi:hypothetical protein